MSFVRPELREALYRWREPIASGALIAVGAWLSFVTTGVPRWLAVAMVGIGVLGLYTGLQRARIRPRSGGRGVVEVDEGQLRYLTGEGGTFLSLKSVTRIEIETTGDGPGADDLFWIFVTPEGTTRIPGAAPGSEKLVDALSFFEGARYEQVIAASSSTEPRLFIIWQKGRLLVH